MRKPRSNKTRGEIIAERIRQRDGYMTSEERHCSRKAMLLYKTIERIKYNENEIAELLNNINNNYVNHIVSVKTQNLIKDLKNELCKAHTNLNEKHYKYQLMLMEILRTCGKNKVLPLP